MKTKSALDKQISWLVLNYEAINGEPLSVTSFPSRLTSSSETQSSLNFSDFLKANPRFADRLIKMQLKCAYKRSDDS